MKRIYENTRVKTYEPVCYDLIREDGRLERTCPHGIGHTVGHVNRKELKHAWMWVHGCDGCCRDYKRMEAGEKR